MLAARYLAFIPFGLYRSVWRYAGARDAVAIASAVVVSEVVALAYMVLTQDMRRLLALVLHRRRADLHRSRRRVALRRAGDRRRRAVGARPHRAAER